MTTLPLAEVRADFSRLVEEAATTHQRIEVTRNGRRAAVLIGADDYDALLETLDVLSDADLVRQLAAAEAEMADGGWHDEDDVRAAMVAAGRL